MALLNYNIRQITNHSAKTMQNVTEEGNYYVFKFGTELDASNPADNKPALKLSYICEPSAIHLPIFIAFSGSTEYNKFNVGKTGMFEIQPEQRLENILTQEAMKENGDIDFQIIGIKVPKILIITDEKGNLIEQKELSFSIDYIIAGDA